MAPQLHPGLFDESFAHRPVQGTLDPLQFSDKLVSETNVQLTEDFKGLRYELDEIRKSSGLKLEKVFQRLELVETKINQLALETKEKLNWLTTRIKENSTTDAKVEALFARHNQLVQNFEVRLSQAQRLIENQSLQINKQQTLIDDSRRQIERLTKY